MQKNEPSIVSVKKVLNVINSCETKKQLNNCKNIIDNYTKYLEKKKIVNVDLVKKRLLKEYNQKKFQLNMLRLFINKNQKEFYTVLDKVLA